MRLTLWVPGLLLPDEIRADTLFDLAAPGLALLLGRGRRETLPPDWLAAAFGQPAPLPAAALRKLGAGEAATANEPLRRQAAEGEILCIDPVHWKVSREGVTLDDPARLALDAAEAQALITVIQPLFADWGEIAASAVERWEMRLRRPLALETRPLPEAIGLPVDPRLPGGPDGREWRTRLAEAQTVLHAHPANRARDAASRPTINSLWPWGQGKLPQSVHCNFTAVWCADPLVVGLCRLAGIPCGAAPEGFAPAAGNVLACIDSLAQPARALDALAWRSALLAFEARWLVPALAALRQGRCTELRLIATRLTHRPATAGFVIKRADLLRFWRRPQPLAALTERERP